MPVENERKYVLSVEDPNALGRELLAKGGKSYRYRQGYIDSVRIREIDNDTTKKALFTYKREIDGELIEIETEISHDDFTKLWTQAEGLIDKVRVKIPHDGRCWEVDFFLDKAGFTYLVMAEVELPVGAEFPSSVPAFIADNLLYLVPRDDHRFFNSKLSDAVAVGRLVDELKAL